MTGGPIDAVPWRERFPELHRILAGYFHQDWQESELNAEETLRLYLIDAPPSVLGVARDEVAELLALGMDEAELARVLHPGLGCFRVPSFAGGSNAGWLEEIGAALRSALDEGSPVGIQHIPLERIGPDRGDLAAASSFPDRATAQTAVQEAIDHSEDAIVAWLDATTPDAGLRLALSHDTGHPVGQLLTRAATDAGDDATAVTGVRLVLERHPTARNGFRVLAHHPDLV